MDSDDWMVLFVGGVLLAVVAVLAVYSVREHNQRIDRYCVALVSHAVTPHDTLLAMTGCQAARDEEARDMGSGGPGFVAGSWVNMFGR